MKIDNSELERILQGEQAKPKKPASSSANSTSDAFGSLFNSELSATDAQAKPSSSENLMHATSLSNSLALSANGATAMAGSKASANEKDVVDSLVSGINDTIEGMDAYAHSVQNPASLKQAWSSLNVMNQNIGSMQKDFGKLSSQSPSIGSMLNELEVIGVTETYKFNRGDYS